MFKKSLSFISVAIGSILSSQQPVAMATGIDYAIEKTMLSGAEITAGLLTVKDTREVAAKQFGMDSPVYGALGKIQDTLLGKAADVGLEVNDEFYKSVTDDAKLDTDVGAATRASQALGHDKLNGADRFSRAGTRS